MAEPRGSKNTSKSGLYSVNAAVRRYDSSEVKITPIADFRQVLRKLKSKGKAMIIFPTGLIEWSMIASQLPPEKAMKFQRFVRRFTLAYWFDGLKVTNLDQHTIEGYDALFSVFLSFTAYELLWDGILSYYDEEILIEEKQNFAIVNPELADRLKHDKKLEAFLHLEDKTNPLTQKIESFFNSEDSNFLPLLAAIKDKVMHGYFSIGTMKAESKEHSVDIWDASRALLVATDDLFHNFVLMET